MADEYINEEFEFEDEEAGRNAILVDLTRCTGCRACQVACQEWHEYPLPLENEPWWNERAEDETSFTGSLDNPVSLSPRTLMHVHFMESVEGVSELRGGKVKMRFQRVSCMHCWDAACKRVCPVEGCITQDPSTGYMTVLNTELCVGCMYCVTTCPFNVPRFDLKTRKA
jgi:formate dehydrogenase iron-sulfur subunit